MLTFKENKSTNGLKNPCSIEPMEVLRKRLEQVVEESFYDLNSRQVIEASMAMDEAVISYYRRYNV